MERGGLVERQETLAVRISLGTYKLFYEAGTEDAMWREYQSGELDGLKERARARDEDRRRSAFLI
jgi:paired amphipathic helix protein Sin3a